MRWLLALGLLLASFGASAQVYGCNANISEASDLCRAKAWAAERDYHERVLRDANLIDPCWTKLSNPPPCAPGASFGDHLPTEVAPDVDDLHVDAQGSGDVVLPEARGPPLLLAQSTPIPGPVQGFYSAGGGGDPYWAFVTYLVGNNNASNGTTTFLDQSTNGLSTTRNGNTVWSSAVQFSGQNTILFDGSGDALKVASNAAFGFGTGDLAVEGEFRATNITSTRILFFYYDGADDMDMSVESDGSLCIWLKDDGFCSSAGAISTNTIYHYAWSKCSGTSRIFINGTVAASAADSRNYGSARSITLGATDSVAGEFVGNHGYHRVTKGSCRGYNTNFTPPTPPVPNS